MTQSEESIDESIAEKDPTGLVQHSERYFPGLDTLRACAIILVVGRHAWEILKWPSLKAFFGHHGWVGVDLFFVLSGFLIGSQLLQSVKRDGRVNFPRFYFKRSLRILPAYFVVLLLYFVWPEFREKPSLEPAWRFLFFVMNFGVKAEAFSHAWSLCVEEHFYLAFPLIVFLYALRPKMFRPSLIIAFVIFGGMAVRYILWASGSPFYPDIYRPTYVHLDGLTVGVGLALLREHRKEIWTKIIQKPWQLFLTGTAVTSIGLLIFGGVRSQHSAEAAVLTYPLVSIGFGAMVASAMAPNFWLCRWRIPGASAIAALAFTLYLTHKQMIHMATMIIDQPNENPTVIILVSSGLTIFASCLLYFGVERPFLKLRDRLLKRD